MFPSPSPPCVLFILPTCAEPFIDEAYWVCRDPGGATQPTKTTQANLESHKVRIVEDSLPKTIRDAISVTRNLGIHFLWIDALCIVQDSLNGEDWHIESAKMSEVYSNAFVTISAEIARDANAGFLLQRTSNATDRSLRMPYHLSSGAQCGTVYIQHPQKRDTLCLSYRAWAFQERRLSTRVL